LPGFAAGHLFFPGGGGPLAEIRIDRLQKNRMRSQLESVLDVHRQLETTIESYEGQTEVEEYRRFWNELRETNRENIQHLSRYMVTKCNR